VVEKKNAHMVLMDDQKEIDHHDDLDVGGNVS
jgi:hypothetical protein